MQTINYSDICFENLSMLDVSSSESVIYLEKKDVKSYIYKIFKNCLDVYALTLKSEKLRLLEKRNVQSSLLIPNAKIMDDSLVGTKEEYIDGIDLCDAPSKYNIDDMTNILLNSSKNLELLHEDGIIMGDANFGNIRIDNQGNPHFIDVLSYSIDNIPAGSSSYIINEYLKSYNKKFKATKGNDKISFLTLSIQLYIDKYFFDITEYDFSKAKEKIKFLKYLEDIFFDLKSSYIKDVPYLHELLPEINTL